MIDFLLAALAVVAATAGLGLVAAIANVLGFWRSLKDVPSIFLPVGFLGAGFGVYLVLRGKRPLDVNDAVQTVIGGFGTFIGALVLAVLLIGLLTLGVKRLWRSIRADASELPPDPPDPP